MIFDRSQFYANPPQQPHPGVFVFPLFKPALCAALLRLAETQPAAAPNSMNKYGVLLDRKDQERWLKQVMRRYVAPLAQDYYPECGRLRDPYGFLVRYAGGKQRALARHIDGPSAVTLNVCLGTTFTGGKLVFHGPRHERFEIAHRVGQAIVHRGQHQHQALSLTSGQRTNLILWCG